MKRRSFFSVVSGVFAGCVLPWKGEVVKPTLCFKTVFKDADDWHYEYRVENYPKAPEGQPCFSNGCVYPSEWTEISGKNLCSIIRSWSIEHAT